MSKKLRAGIVCDDYKLPTFRRILEQAGYEIIETHKGPARDVTTLIVLTESQATLTAVIKTCERTAKKGGE